MSTQVEIAGAVDREATSLYRVGGLAALAIGAAYFVIIALFVSAGEPPTGGEARLEYLVGKTAAWWGIVGTSVLTNFLYVPVALALYMALKRVHQAAMLIGGAFIGLFVLLENAVNWTIYGALIVLSGEYAAATGEAQRAAVVAAATFASSVLTNFLYVPVALALYMALKRVHQSAMLIGGAFIGLFAILENAVNWTIYGALIVLSGEYAAATGEAQRAAVVAAATFASAVLGSPLAAVWAIGTLSFAFLVIGFVMLKGVFSKVTAYVGILTGVLGFFAVAGVGIAVYLNAIGALIWLLLVGYRLYRLSLP